MNAKIITLTAPGFEGLQWWLRKLAREGVPPDAREVYRNRRNSIYAVSIDGQELNIKAFGMPRFPNNYVYTRWRDSKARRSLDNALTLRRLGIETPKPVGAVEVIENGQLTHSYYVSRQINITGDMRDWSSNPEAAAAVPDLAALMVRLHAQGVFHKDLSAGNIMIKRDRRGRRHLLLIDLNRMEFSVFDHRRQMENFERIYPESAEETARLARLYARAAGLDEETTVSEAEAARQHYLRGKARFRTLKRLLRGKPRKR